MPDAIRTAFRRSRHRRALAIGLLLLAAGALGLAQFPAVRTLYFAAITEEAAGAELAPPEARRLAAAGQLTLVDIRRPEEWAATGVPEGAMTLDMRRADFASALAEAVGGDRSAPVALICARGVRSARLSNRLTEAGFRNVADVPEGMLGSRAGPGWLARGLPTTPPLAGSREVP
jgi:rhodanese-related sulfurtransferase